MFATLFIASFCLYDKTEVGWYLHAMVEKTNLQPFVHESGVLYVKSSSSSGSLCENKNMRCFLQHVC